MAEKKPVLETMFATTPPAKIAFLKFILEGYDGLALLSTADRDSGLVSLHYHPACRAELHSILESLGVKAARPQPIINIK